jgi:hypothetical protein
MTYQDDYFPYDEETVRAILLAWPRAEAAREKGTLILQPVIQTKVDPKELQAWKAIKSVQMWKTPSRVRNETYKIDDVGAVLCDVFGALKKLKPWEQMRLKFHFYYGYTHKEIAEMCGLTEAAIQASCDKAIYRIAKMLETPAEAKYEAPIKRNDSHKRKYESIPQYAF